MAKVKVKVAVHTWPDAKEDQYARAWIPAGLAKKLDLKAEEWIYLSKDWIGVLSTQAKVEGILEVKEEDVVYFSPDRMKDAHFTDGITVSAWKFTEWD